MLSIAGAAVSPTNKRWRLPMQPDELSVAGQSLPDRTVSAASEVRRWLPLVRLRRLQIDLSPRRHDYTPEEGRMTPYGKYRGGTRNRFAGISPRQSLSIGGCADV